MKRITVFAAIAMIAAAFAAASPASGAVRYQSTGRPGPAAMPPMYGWYGGFTLQNVLRFSARRIGRSPLAPRRNQTICAQYKLYHFLPSYLGEPPMWTSSWNSGLACNVVPPGRALTVGSMDVEPLPQKAYNAEVWVTWRAGGRRIASAKYDYSSTSDYSCQTFKCSTDYGYQNVAYIMFDY
jgi:hypothetical protein